MANWAAYKEAYKRGILPPEKAALYDEALLRGLVPKEFLPEDVQPVVEQTSVPDVPQHLSPSIQPVEQPDDVQPIVEPGFESITEFVRPVTEFISGSTRETRATRELPELGSGGLLYGEDQSKVAAIASVLATTTDPKELGDILNSQFDNIRITEDEKGNLIANNTNTGAKAVINKPGMSKLDLLQSIGLAAAFTPAGFSTGLAKSGVAKSVSLGISSAATEAAIQANQQLAGGEFDTNEVAIAGALGPVAQITGGIIERGSKMIRGNVPEELDFVMKNRTVLSSDILPPDTFMGKLTQKIGERIPVMGTGGIRAKQQIGREDAVKELMADFEIDDKSEFGSKIIESAARMFAKSKKRSDELRADAVQQLNVLGEKIPTKTLAVIDEQLTKIKGQGALADKALIKNLNNIKSEVASGNFEKLKDIRTIIFDMQIDVSGMKSPMRQGADRYLKPISGALSDDLIEISKEIPDAQRKWKASNKIYRGNYTKAKETELKKLLTKGTLTPEIVETTLRTGKKSSLRRLNANLDAEGRKGVRQQILKLAVDKAITDDYINPNAFKTALDKSKDQINIFFKGSDKKQLKGIQKFLTITRRAQDAGQDIASKQEVWGATLMGGGLSAGNLLGKAAAMAGGIGLVARTYESKPIRTLLIKLANAEKGSALEANLIKGIKNAIIAQTEKDIED